MPVIPTQPFVISPHSHVISTEVPAHRRGDAAERSAVAMFAQRTSLARKRDQALSVVERADDAVVILTLERSEGEGPRSSSPTRYSPYLFNQQPLPENNSTHESATTDNQ